MSGCSTEKGDRSIWHPVTFMLVRVLSAKLFYEADSNTVLLRSLERIDGVTEIFSDDPVLIDTCSNDGSSNDLRSLLLEEEVSLGSTGSLVSITGNANLGVRVSLESLDNLVDLDLLALADVPLVDDEEDVAGKRLECRLNNYRLLYNRFRFWLRCRCRRYDDRCRSWLCLTEAEGKTCKSLDLEVSLGTLLRVEVVADEA